MGVEREFVPTRPTKMYSAPDCERTRLAGVGQRVTVTFNLDDFRGADCFGLETIHSRRLWREQKTQSERFSWELPTVCCGT